MATRPLPTPELLRQLLDYDPKSGVLTWRSRHGRGSARWNSRYAGAAAGGPVPEGYIFLKIFNRSFAAHRVIWAMVHDYWPGCVDHKNGKPADNRLRNLRAVSRQMNQRNQARHKSNTSGRTGVTWNRFRSCWVAMIGMSKKSIYLGSFQSFDDAVAARRAAERANGFTGRQ